MTWSSLRVSFLSLRLHHNILLPLRLIRPVLALQDHRAALQDLHAMPLADGDAKRHAVAARLKVDDIGHLARLVIKHLAKVPAQAH